MSDTAEIVRKMLNDTELNNKVNDTCTGVECIRSDVDEIKKVINELKSVPCSGKNGCNSLIPVGSNFCPGCGRKIKGWK